MAGANEEVGAGHEDDGVGFVVVSRVGRLLRADGLRTNLVAGSTIAEFALLGNFSFSIDVLPLPIEVRGVIPCFPFFHYGPPIEILTRVISVLRFEEHRAFGQGHTGRECRFARFCHVKQVVRVAVRAAFSARTYLRHVCLVVLREKRIGVDFYFAAHDQRRKNTRGSQSCFHEKSPFRCRLVCRFMPARDARGGAYAQAIPDARDLALTNNALLSAAGSSWFRFESNFASPKICVA